MHGLHLIRQKSENFCHLPLKGKALSCSIQHIFNKDAISGSGVVDENVGDSADEFAVLDNGTAAHTLDDAAGGGEQIRVGDTQEHISAAVFAYGINFQDLHRIFPGRIAGDCAADKGIAGMDILFFSNGNCLAAPAIVCISKNALQGIFL